MFFQRVILLAHRHHKRLFIAVAVGLAVAEAVGWLPRVTEDYVREYR